MDIRDKFWSGDYSGILSQATITPITGEQNLAMMIAAMALSGQVHEAELLLNRESAGIGPDGCAEALAHIVMAYLAREQFPEARRSVTRMFGLRNSGLSPSGLFYLFYALASCRYSMGRISQCLANLRRASQFVKRARSEYVGFLWSELIGHALCMTGDTESGQGHLLNAIRSAKLMGRDKAIPQLHLRALLFESRYSILPVESIASLNRTLRDDEKMTAAERASVYLELSRNYSTTGQASRSRECLIKAAQELGPAMPRRFQVALGLRSAEHLLAASELSSALMTLNLVETILVDEDILYLLELLALRILASTRLNMNAQADSDRLRKVTRICGAVNPCQLKQPGSGRRAPDEVVLNHRQLTWSSERPAGEFFSVHDYKSRFGLSELTACRDLSGLVKAGIFMKSGSARATRYWRREAPKPET